MLMYLLPSSIALLLFPSILRHGLLKILLLWFRFVDRSLNVIRITSREDTGDINPSIVLVTAKKRHNHRLRCPVSNDTHIVFVNRIFGLFVSGCDTFRFCQFVVHTYVIDSQSG